MRNRNETTNRSETMNATAQDYEKLARTTLIARSDDPDETEIIIINGQTTRMPAWEFESLDADNDCVSATRDTLDDFREARRHWSEPGTMQEINGGLYWEECQAAKGQRRSELCVVDCGDFRLCYQV